MNPTLAFSLINVLIHALGSLPSIEGDFKSALSANWGKDHVQQAVLGLGFLNKIVGDVAGAFGAPAVDVLPAPVSAAPVAAAPTPVNPVI